MLMLGAVLITMSSQVKLPSLLALGFVAMALARRWGGNVKAFLAPAGCWMPLSLAVMAVIGWASGLGFGWLFTLGTANVVRSWMSPPTLLALGTGQVGILLGLGDHTTAVLSLTRAIGVLIIAVLVSLAAAGGAARPAASGRRARRGARRDRAAVPGGAAVVPAVGDHPAGGVGDPARFRITTIVVTLVVGIFGPTANGDRFALFQIVDATLASAIIVVLLIALTYTELPWRSVPHPGVRRSTRRHARAGGPATVPVSIGRLPGPPPSAGARRLR